MYQAFDFFFPSIIWFCSCCICLISFVAFSYLESALSENSDVILALFVWFHYIFCTVSFFRSAVPSFVVVCLWFVIFCSTKLLVSIYLSIYPMSWSNSQTHTQSCECLMTCVWPIKNVSFSHTGVGLFRGNAIPTEIRPIGDRRASIKESSIYLPMTWSSFLLHTHTHARARQDYVLFIPFFLAVFPISQYTYQLHGFLCLCSFFFFFCPQQNCRIYAPL